MHRFELNHAQHTCGITRCMPSVRARTVAVELGTVAGYLAAIGTYAKRPGFGWVKESADVVRVEALFH